MGRRLVVLIVLALAAPSAAHAAEVSASGGVLRYKATPGKVSNVVFTETGAGVVQVTTLSDDTDGLSPTGPECSGTPITCSGVTSVAVDAGDMGDRITATYGDRANPSGLKNIPAIIV